MRESSDYERSVLSSACRQSSEQIWYGQIELCGDKLRPSHHPQEVNNGAHHGVFA
jgi:hypothetical protein